MEHVCFLFSEIVFGAYICRRASVAYYMGKGRGGNGEMWADEIVWETLPRGTAQSGVHLF